MYNILGSIFSNISRLEDFEGLKSLDKFFKCCHVTDRFLDPEKVKDNMFVSSKERLVSR